MYLELLMRTNMLKVLLILSIFTFAWSNGQMYRFDYEFNGQANGWLKFHPIPGTWDEARNRCYAEGAVLASPLTKELKAAMLSFVVKQKGPGSTSFFTGVHATFSKGDYSSIEGVHWLRMPIVWSTGEPDNFENKESCLAMMTDSKGSMSDVNCEDVLPYVCYKEYSHLKMSECGTTDPEYKLEPRTGSCYKFHSQVLDWAQAYMTCIAEGGYLVTIDSEEEINVVKELYDKNLDDLNTFLYLNNRLGLGFHIWSEANSGCVSRDRPRTNTFTMWNKKNFRAGPDRCGSIVRSGKLDDISISCTDTLAFLCEKEPSSLLPL